MTKYSLLQSAIVAAAVALFVPAFCVPVEGGENSTSIIPALAPAIELNTRSILNKRGSSFVNVGAASCFQGAFVHKYVNEKVRHETQERTSRTRFTAINETPEPLWIWIEIRIGDDTFRVPDPDATWTQKIKIDPGESVQVGNIPIHSGNIRAYARCNENGVQCAGDEGTATKWEWTTEPEPDKTPNTAGINLSLVDGYAIGGKMTFGEGSDCWPITCIISQEHLRTICPSQNLQDHVPEWLNCKSDCRTHVAHELCCTGPWDSPECKPSSPYFSQACPAAYAWPHDDGAAHYQACHPHGEVALRLRQR